MKPRARLQSPPDLEERDSDDRSPLLSFGSGPPPVQATPFRESTRRGAGPVSTFFANHYRGALTVLLLSRVLLSVGNRVSYKLMLVPMGPYGILLSMMMSLVYVVFYGIMFAVAFASGWVTDAGLRSIYAFGLVRFKLVKLLILGLMDAMGNVLGIISAAHISGSLLIVLSNALTPVTMLVSWVYLRKRFTLWQVLAAGVVIAGISFAAVDPHEHLVSGSGAKGAGTFFYVLLNVAGLFPNAVSFTVKESIFNDVNGLHVLTVNFLSSIFQVVFTFAFLPIVMIPHFGPKEITFKALPKYVSHGLSCWAGNNVTAVHANHSAASSYNAYVPDLQAMKVDPFDISSVAANTPHERGVDLTCSGMPYFWLFYLVMNVAFNICMLLVVKYGSGKPTYGPNGVAVVGTLSGAVLNFMVGMVATTFTFFAFTIDLDIDIWHNANVYTPLTARMGVGFAIAVAGLILYQIFSQQVNKWRKSVTSSTCFGARPLPWKSVDSQIPPLDTIQALE